MRLQGEGSDQCHSKLGALRSVRAPVSNQAQRASCIVHHASCIMRLGGNLQTNSSEVIRASVMAGMGIVYVPTWLFDEEIASGEVQRLMPD